MKNVWLQVRISEELKKRFFEFCRKEAINPSELIRQWIQDWIKRKEAERVKVILHGHEVDFEAAVMLMDDQLREELHRELAPCAPQEFLDEYVRRHRAKYGEDFVVN